MIKKPFTKSELKIMKFSLMNPGMSGKAAEKEISQVIQTVRDNHEAYEEKRKKDKYKDPYKKGRLTKFQENFKRLKDGR